jgi:putative oxidoreductase
MSYGILLLRVVVGGTLFSHGAQKLFGWWGGGGPRGTGAFFGQMRFRSPVLMALLAGLGETGGILFALGLLTPLAALGIATVMLVAIWSVHWQNGFFNGKGGIEFPLTLAAAAVAVAATGPARFSLDRLIGWDGSLSGLWWGVGVAGVTLVASTLVMALRKPAEAAMVERAAAAETGPEQRRAA